MRSVARPILVVALALVPGATVIACSGSDTDHVSTSGHTSRPSSGTTRGTTSTTKAPAADPDREPAAAPRVILEPPGAEPVTVNVEVARTSAETQRGLMFRRHMDPNAGMIFLFPRSRQLTFWMHNTYIPLDMIFIQSDMRVLGVVENAPPETDDGREVEGVSQFVLEVNAGFAREHGIGAGTVVRFEGIPDVPVDGAAGDDEDDEDWEDEE
jgi:uncharacterized membrane protein (UPF0127 family)